MKIWFDMDGTIADLYGVEDWLPKLRAHDASPYKEAAPLLRLCSLARILNRLQRDGHEIGIISWLSKDPDPLYGEAVTEAKREWLDRHLPSVNWNNIFIVPYGTSKYEVCGEGMLFDDEAQNRRDWKGEAYSECAIIEILKTL